MAAKYANVEKTNPFEDKDEHKKVLPRFHWVNKGRNYYSMGTEKRAKGGNLIKMHSRQTIVTRKNMQN